MDQFRKPLGLVLSGGGALGAWQAGCLDALVSQGVIFDSVFGFSAGVLNAAHYFIGWDSKYLDRWRTISERPTLRFSPRFSPISLFSDEPILEATREFADDEKAKSAARCHLVVVSLGLREGKYDYAHFAPKESGKWDGPLALRLKASCSIPIVFPPVFFHEKGNTQIYIDGGVRGREKMSFESLSHCQDVIILELVRPEEVGRRYLGPLKRHDQKSREVVRKHMDYGIESLSRLSKPPRIFRLCPSRILDFTMLAFDSKYCVPSVDLGASDGMEFLKSPERFRVSAPAASRQ